MLHVIEPLAVILSVIGVYKHAIPVSFVILPVALIYIPVSRCHSTLLISLVFAPHALILRTIRPELDTTAVPLTCLLVPLSLIELTLVNIFELIYVDPLHAVVPMKISLLQLELLHV